MNDDRPVSEESSSAAAIGSQRLHDPDVRERLRQIHDQINNVGHMSPGIAGEDLPDFLREHRKHLDT